MSASAEANEWYKQHLEKLKNAGKAGKVAMTAPSTFSDEGQAKTELKHKLAGVIGKIESKHRASGQSVKRQNLKPGIDPASDTRDQGKKLNIESTSDNCKIEAKSKASPDELKTTYCSKDKMSLETNPEGIATEIGNQASSAPTPNTATAGCTEGSNTAVKSQLTNVIAKIESKYKTLPEHKHHSKTGSKPLGQTGHKIASVIGQIESKYKALPEASLPMKAAAVTKPSFVAEQRTLVLSSPANAFENKLANVIGKIESKHTPGPKFTPKNVTNAAQMTRPSRTSPGMLSTRSSGVMEKRTVESETNLKKKLANVLGKIETTHKGIPASNFGKASSRTELQSKLAGVLGQIESKHKNILPTIKQGNITRVDDAEQSDAYLEHLAKLRKKSKPLEENLKTHTSLEHSGTTHLGNQADTGATMQQNENAPAFNSCATGAVRTVRSVLVKEETMSPFQMQSQIARLEVCVSSRREGSANVTTSPIKLLNRRDEGLADAPRLSSQDSNGSGSAVPQTGDGAMPQSHRRRSTGSVAAEQHNLPVFVAASDPEEASGSSSHRILNESFALPKSSQIAAEIHALKGILKRSHDDGRVSNGSKFSPSPAKIQRHTTPTQKSDMGIPENDVIGFVPSLPRNDSTDDEMAEGLEFLHPVSGYHCILCSEFFQDYPTALHHCSLSAHKIKTRRKKKDWKNESSRAHATTTK